LTDQASVYFCIHHDCPRQREQLGLSLNDHIFETQIRQRNRERYPDRTASDNDNVRFQGSLHTVFTSVNASEFVPRNYYLFAT
jgi:hypothetical protein